VVQEWPPLPLAARPSPPFPTTVEGNFRMHGHNRRLDSEGRKPAAAGE